MSATLVRTAGGVWARTLPQRGPTGRRRPSRTAPYSAPATHQVASLTNINTRLAAHDGSFPMVLELTGDLTGSPDDITYVAGSEGWAYRVLIRPPLGERASVASLWLRCANTVLAGVDYESISVGRATVGQPNYGKYSGVWRGYGKLAQAFLGLTGSDYSSLLECVSEREFVGNADRAQVKFGADAVKGNVGSSIVGCYFGRGRRATGDAHLDTVQLAGGGGASAVSDFTLRDTVALGSSNAAFQIGGVTGYVVVDNCFLELLPVGTSGDAIANAAGAYAFGPGPATDSRVVVVNTQHGNDTLAGVPLTYAGNKTTSALDFGAVDGTNLIDAALDMTPPPLPNLAAIWPECPVVL